jgi:hypothetical protein
MVSLQKDTEQTRNNTLKIFDFEQLKMGANDLDWDPMPKKLCDGSKEIDWHNDKLPDKNLKYCMFDFANHVAKCSRLSA